MAKINIHTHHPTADERTISTVGVHPYDVERVGERALIELSEQACEADALGEMGLDFACGADRELQESLFRYQLSLAERLQKPVILHCVRAFEPVMNILDEYELGAVIFHGFVGSAEQAVRAVKSGYYLSFGHRTFASPKTIEALRQTPSERLFVETDDEEVGIDEIYEGIASLLGVEVESLEESVERNFEKIFGKR